MRERRACADFGRSSLSRRQMLQVGALGTLGLSLPAALRAEARSGLKVRAKSVIFLHQFGGVPQQDTFDMKPNAPAELRGEFKPIPSSLPGLDVCELLPRMSRIMHNFTVVRSVNHRVSDAQLGGLLLADRPSAPGRHRLRHGLGLGLPRLRLGRQQARTEREAGAHVRLAALDDRRRRVPHAGRVRGLSGQGARPPVHHQGPERPELLGRGADAADRGAAGAGLVPSGVALGPGRLFPAQRFDRGRPRPGRLPAEGALAPDLVRDAAGLRHPGRGSPAPRPLRPHALRPERAHGPAAGRGRRAVRDRLLLAGHRRLGHAQRQLQPPPPKAPARHRTDPADPDRGPRRRAACSTTRWSSGRASSAARRRSTRTPAATTGRSATPCSWPAAA